MKKADIAPAKPKRPPLDWEAIEREYRAGQLSIGQLAKENDCTRQAIIKRAKLSGWTRNLAAAVQVETERRLLASAVTPAVTAATAREIVDAAADRNERVVLAHRSTLDRLHGIINRAFKYLEAEEKDGPSMEPRDFGGLIRDCSGAMSKLIPLERQAFNISGEAVKVDPGHDDLSALPAADLAQLKTIRLKIIQGGKAKVA